MSSSTGDIVPIIDQQELERQQTAEIVSLSVQILDLTTDDPVVTSGPDSGTRSAETEDPKLSTSASDEQPVSCILDNTATNVSDKEDVDGNRYKLVTAESTRNKKPREKDLPVQQQKDVYVASVPTRPGAVAVAGNRAGQAHRHRGTDGDNDTTVCRTLSIEASTISDDEVDDIIDCGTLTITAFTVGDDAEDEIERRVHQRIIEQTVNAEVIGETGSNDSTVLIKKNIRHRYRWLICFCILLVALTGSVIGFMLATKDSDGSNKAQEGIRGTPVGGREQEGNSGDKKEPEYQADEKNGSDIQGGWQGNSTQGRQGNNTQGWQGNNAQGSQGSNMQGSQGSNMQGSQGNNTQESQGNNTQESQGNKTQGFQGNNTQGFQGNNSQGWQENNTQGSQGNNTQGSQGNNTQGSQGNNTQGFQGNNTQGFQGNNINGGCQGENTQGQKYGQGERALRTRAVGEWMDYREQDSFGLATTGHATATSVKHQFETVWHGIRGRRA